MVSEEELLPSKICESPLITCGFFGKDAAMLKLQAKVVII